MSFFYTFILYTHIIFFNNIFANEIGEGESENFVIRLENSSKPKVENSLNDKYTSCLKNYLSDTFCLSSDVALCPKESSDLVLWGTETSRGVIFYTLSKYGVTKKVVNPLGSDNELLKYKYSIIANRFRKDEKNLYVSHSYSTFVDGSMSYFMVSPDNLTLEQSTGIESYIPINTEKDYLNPTEANKVVVNEIVNRISLRSETLGLSGLSDERKADYRDSEIRYLCLCNDIDSSEIRSAVKKELQQFNANPGMCYTARVNVFDLLNLGIRSAEAQVMNQNAGVKAVTNTKLNKNKTNLVLDSKFNPVVIRFRSNPSSVNYVKNKSNYELHVCSSGLYYKYSTVNFELLSVTKTCEKTAVTSRTVSSIKNQTAEIKKNSIVLYIK